MFTSGNVAFYGSIPIIFAFYIAIFILAVNIAGRKRKWYELLLLSAVLSGFVFLISLNITEIDINPKFSLGLIDGFFLRRCKNAGQYIIILLFNLLFYTTASFYSAFVSKMSLKKLLLKNTVLFVPLNVLFLVLSVSHMSKDTSFDYVIFAEIYIGSLIGFRIAEKLKKPKKEVSL